MNIESTLEYIHSVKWQGSKPGLERTNELLSALGNPEKSLKFVHIAGTNGKGSTASFIASVLTASGYRTGLYTSPYILRFNERIQVDSTQISDDELIDMVEKIKPYAGKMSDPPTEFELITALGMMYFALKRCDIVVLEVGLGGQLDSTNVIDTPEAAVITAIGLDHTAELGGTLEEIAEAKAGIIKPNSDVVIYGGTKEVEAVFDRHANEKNAKIHRADFSRIIPRELTLEGNLFDFTPYKNIKLSLIGTYQTKNAAVAITALEVLRNKGYKITDDDIVKGISSVCWPGRFEVLARAPIFILDGTHNPHGIEVTAETIRHHFPNREIVFLIGVMQDKDLSGMVSAISPFAKSFIAVKPLNPRAMDEHELAVQLRKSGKEAIAYPSVSDGVCAAVEQAGPDGIVCSLGSLYFSADIRNAVLALNLQA